MSALKRQSRLIRRAARLHAKARLLDQHAEFLLDLAKVEGRLADAEARIRRNGVPVMWP